MRSLSPGFGLPFIIVFTLTLSLSGCFRVSEIGTDPTVEQQQAIQALEAKSEVYAGKLSARDTVYTVGKIEIEDKYLYFEDLAANETDSVRLDEPFEVKYESKSQGITDGVLFGTAASIILGGGMGTLVWLSDDLEGDYDNPVVIPLGAAVVGTFMLPIGGIVGGVNKAKTIYRSVRTEQ